MLENLFVIPLIVSAALAYWATPLVIKFAWKFGLIDDPKVKHAKKLHTKPIPRAGGLAIFIAIIVSSLIFLPIDKHLIGILLGVTVLLVVGLLDDKYDLNPYLRIFLQFFAAGLPIAAGIGIAFISNPFGGTIDLSNPRVYFDFFGTHSIWILSDLFALFWIVTIMNFINWGAKGVDGQLPGVVGIAAIVIGIQSIRFSADITEWPVIVLAAITAGAFLGFLPFNKFPQKIMPAFSGSMIGGFLLAVLSILTTTKVGILLIVLAIPLIDSFYTVIRRILSGKSPVWGDRGHLHHRLIDSAGWSKSKVAKFYWAVTAVLGVIVLFLDSQLKLYTVITLIIAIGALIVFLKYKK